jgi:hypothetical protein
MTHRFDDLQPNLFETERPFIELRADQRRELATVLKLMLREIAVALVKATAGSRSDEQNHD